MRMLAVLGGGWILRLGPMVWSFDFGEEVLGYVSGGPGLSYEWPNGDGHVMCRYGHGYHSMGSGMFWEKSVKSLGIENSSAGSGRLEAEAVSGGWCDFDGCGSNYALVSLCVGGGGGSLYARGERLLR